MNLLDLLSANTHPGGAAGMVDRGQDPGGIASLLQGARSPATLAASTPPPQTHPNRRRVFGIIGDALAGFNGQPGLYAEAMNKRHDLAQQSQLEQQRWEGQQAYKDAHPDPTSLQRNAEYLNSVHPGLGDTYLNAEGNPLAAMDVTDPATGARSLRFYPKGNPGALGGTPQGGPPVGSVVSGHRFLGGNPNDQRSWAPIGGSSAPPVTGFR